MPDLARSKSELVAENALLRQQLIILPRQVKRPTCAKTDRLILVLLPRASRAWKHAHITCPTRDAPAVASPGMRGCDKLYLCFSLFIHITGRVFHIALLPRILERISHVASTAVSLLGWGNTNEHRKTLQRTCNGQKCMTISAKFY